MGRFCCSCSWFFKDWSYDHAPFKNWRCTLCSSLWGWSASDELQWVGLTEHTCLYSTGEEEEEEEAQPSSPGTHASGANMLPLCITRLTKLEQLRLAGDWRRPKVPFLFFPAQKPFCSFPLQTGCGYKNRSLQLLPHKPGL